LCQIGENELFGGLVVDLPRHVGPHASARMEMGSVSTTDHFDEPLPWSSLQHLPDDELVLYLQKGQSDALAVLFDRYQKLVLSIALKLVRDRGEAEDVTQIVFLDIYRAVAQFDPGKGNTKVWIMQYAYHRAINRRQHLQCREFYTTAELEEVDARPLESQAIFGLSRPETRELVRKSIASLSEEQRSVIELASYEGLSMKEIAERTGESFANVRHHYYRGLHKLRSLISGQDDRRTAQGGKCA
jgi:RNA polymerase sigma-70 factor, ECF subfamily